MFCQLRKLIERSLIGPSPTLSEKRRRQQAGFTLVELLVVLVILVLIAGLVGPRVLNYLDSSKTKTAKIQIESLSTTLELFKLDTGNYPSQRDGLSALVEQPSGVTNWAGPYLKKGKVPVDPWGNEYHYQFPGKKGVFDIYSYGADNKEGGEGVDQDVASWL